MINSQNGVVHMKGTFNTAIINVLWQIVASKRFDPDAQDTLEMMDMLNRQFTSGNDSNIRTLFPIFLGRFFPLDDFDTSLFAMKKLMKQLIGNVKLLHLVVCLYTRWRFKVTKSSCCFIFCQLIVYFY